MMSAWSDAVVRLMEGPAPSLDELAAILYARGRHAMAGGAPLAADARIASVAEPADLEAAALAPGADALVRRLERALPYLDDLDDSIAHEAEQSVADVLDASDRWAVRSAGLEAFGLTDVAAKIRIAHALFARRLVAHRGALSALGWMAEAKRREAPEPEVSAWRLVPVGETEERATTSVDVGDVTDDDLALAALGEATPDVRARLAHALASSEEVRARYERFLELAPGFEEASRTRERSPEARRLEHVRLAAADHPQIPYEKPADEALVHVFGDASELYVERDRDMWLVRLYRAAVSPDDGIEPLASRFEVREVLGGRVERGPITVRHAGETLTWELDDVR